MSETWKKIIAYIAFGLLSFVCGLPLIWGNISLYIYSSFLGQDHENNFGLFNFAFMLGTLFFILGSITKGIISNKFSQLLVIIVSLIFTIVSLFLTLVIKNIYLFVFVYNVVIGFFLGVLYPIPVQNFPEDENKEGKNNIKLIFHLITGLNPFIFNFMAFKLWNPDNIPVILTKKMFMYEPIEVSNNYNTFFEYLSIIYLVLSVLIIIGLIIVRTQYVIQYNEILLDSPKINSHQTVLKSICSKDFLKMFCMSIFSSIFIEYFIVYYKEIAFSNHNDDEFMSSLGATCFLIFQIGFIFWREFSKKINNFFLPLTIIIIVQSLSGFLFKFAAKSNGMLFFMNCLIFFIGGGQYALYELMAKNKYKDHPKKNIIVGIAKMSFAVSLLLVILIHYIFFENIGYNNLIIVMTLFGFLTFIFFL